MAGKARQLTLYEKAELWYKIKKQKQLPEQQYPTILQDAEEHQNIGKQLGQQSQQQPVVRAEKNTFDSMLEKAKLWFHFPKNQQLQQHGQQYLQKQQQQQQKVQQQLQQKQQQKKQEPFQDINPQSTDMTEQSPTSAADVLQECAYEQGLSRHSTQMSPTPAEHVQQNQQQQPTHSLISDFLSIQTSSLDPHGNAREASGGIEYVDERHPGSLNQKSRRKVLLDHTEINWFPFHNIPRFCQMENDWYWVKKDEQGTVCEEKSSMLSRSSDHENEDVKLTYENLTRLKEIISAGPDNKKAVNIIDAIKQEDDIRLKTEIFQYLAELLRCSIISREKHAKFRIWVGKTIFRAEKIKFVCLYKGKLETQLPSFFDIDIHYKDIDIPEPIIDIEDHEKLNWEMTTDLDASLLQSAIEVHGDTLFKQHSNLQVICGGPFSIRNCRVVKQCTIILYCHAKGIIPYGEETFPSSLNFNGINIPVDIREGHFVLAVGRQEWHKSLCMGISIGEKGVGWAGTLGPFVSLGHNEYGFLTCAHVVGDVGKEVVQPSKGDSRGQKTEEETICGTVEKFVFEPDFCNRMNGLTKTGVDAALVKLNKDRGIEATNFAEVQEADLYSIGFAPETKFHYVGGCIGCPRESRKARGKMVIKYGRTTGLTKGVMVLEGAMVKIDDLELFYEKWNSAFILKGQYLVDGIAGYQFAAPGDSGAGVFTLDDENKLTLIGLVAGVLNARLDHRCVVTPIEHILTALALDPKDLKFDEKMEI